MSVAIREYPTGGLEVDIRFRNPNGKRDRERVKSPVTGLAATRRWAEDRERHLVRFGKPEKVSREQEEQRQGRATLADFAPRFLSGYATANRQKPSGIAAKECILRVHLKPQLGAKPLDEISTEDVQRLKSRLAGKSAKTVNNVLTVLNVMLRTAVEWGVIDRMPCAIRLVRVPPTRAAFHDEREYEKLVTVAKKQGLSEYLIILLGGDAGLRCGEMMALRWSDVDLGSENPQLTVEQSDWKGHVTSPKGGRLRHVQLTRRLTDALRSARHLRGERVLMDEDGKPMTQKVVQGVVLRVSRRAGVRPGVHILRHTFCSRLAMRGIPVRTIQELAGHQDLGTTQRYMHVSPSAVSEAIRALDHPVPTPARGGIREAAGIRG